ncbi:amino acid adenylation domain-containing protein [Streptomyces sp. NPDC087658]|uniref:non-ribosomal peptide synthetase n=1 Tax=Streptomyces sp. NPDC087658 TaxID=3365800 RepID=UPI00382CD86F
MSDAITRPPWPQRGLHELVADQAGRTPDRVAVRCGSRSLSYRELLRAATRVTARLVARGAGPGQVVAVMIDRSVDLPVALLGVLRSGAAFVPIDPSYPRERQEYMARDTGAVTTLTVERLAEHAVTADVLTLDKPGFDAPPAEASAPGRRPGPDAPPDLAYVMYTSGSTGEPKGVAVNHRCLVKGVLAMGAVVEPEPADVWLSVTSASFDPVLVELFLPLVHGSTVVIATEQQVLGGEALLGAVAGSGATVLQATPLTWNLLLDSGWTGGLRVALCGGESLAPALAARLTARCRRVWNIYGPTETTVWSTAHRVTTSDQGVVPVGHPLPDTTVRVLDEQMRAVTHGERGEVWIGGGGVAHGYFGRPALTDERFVPDPIASDGSRLYRTGDLGRLRDDGALELLGRADHQMKIRGHRVEPGEIENRLRDHPSVADAMVLAQSDGGEQRLVAYVRPVGDRTLDVPQLRTHAAARLPRHMVPGAFVRVDVWPRTPNGKIDRRALLALPAFGPESTGGPGEAVGAASHVAWDDEVTDVLAGVWQELLGTMPSGPEENFFGLGGHSLQVMRMVQKIRARLGVRMNAARLMQVPTLASQAALVKAALSASAPGTAAADGSRVVPAPSAPCRRDALPGTASDDPAFTAAP